MTAARAGRVPVGMDDQLPPTENDQASRVEETEPAEGEFAEMQDTEWKDPSLPNTFPSGSTVDADRRDADAQHVPDDVDPSVDLDAVPESVSESVAAAERASLERGANVKGEGEI